MSAPQTHDPPEQKFDAPPGPGPLSTGVVLGSALVLTAAWIVFLGWMVAGIV